MKRNIFIVIMSLFLCNSSIFAGELQTSGFTMFSQDVLSRQSNIINFASGFDNEVIGWQDVTEELPGGLSLEPGISLDEFLSVAEQAITELKARNQIFQQMGYGSWMIGGVAKYLWQKDFEPFKVAKTFDNSDDIHVFGAQNSSVHDLAFSLYNFPGYNQAITLFQPGSWELLNKLQHKHFVITGLVGSGLYGIETVYLALKLYIANPDNIFIVQGFDEMNILSEEMRLRYGQEGIDRFAEIQNKIIRLYRYLPVAFFAGFEKENTHHWYLISHGGVQSGDSQIQELFAQARDNGIAYKKVTNFSGQSTGYQNKDEINIDTLNASQLFGMIGIGQDNILKGAIFGGRHTREMNNEAVHMLKYGYFSRPGFISLAPTPLSLFGVSKQNEYPGVIHRTSLQLNANHIHLWQYVNVEILSSVKKRYAEIMLDQEGSYISPLYVADNRIIGEVSLENDDIIPVLEFNADMFRQEESIERINQDIQAIKLIAPVEISEIQIVEQESFDESNGSDDKGGMQQAVQTLEPQTLEIYEQVVTNEDFGWKEVVKKTKKASLWDFLMSIKPEGATLDDWVATINDSYFWTTNRPTSLKGWKQTARVRWRDYMSRKTRLEKGRK